MLSDPEISGTSTFSSSFSSIGTPTVSTETEYIKGSTFSEKR